MYHEFGPLACSNPELTFEITNPFRHSDRAPGTGNWPIVHLCLYRTAQHRRNVDMIHALSGIRTDDPSQFSSVRRQ
jgi:hypothetical protein